MKIGHDETLEVSLGMPTVWGLRFRSGGFSECHFLYKIKKTSNSKFLQNSTIVDSQQGGVIWYEGRNKNKSILQTVNKFVVFNPTRTLNSAS